MLGYKELTESELKVFHLIVRGATNNEAAVALSLKPKTIKWHLNSIYKKTSCSTRMKLTVAYRNYIGMSLSSLEVLNGP